MLDSILNSLKNSSPPTPTMLAQLPLNPKNLDKIDQVISESKQLISSLDNLDEFQKTIDGIEALEKARNEELGLIEFDFDHLILLLENNESYLPKKTTKAIQKQYRDFVEHLAACADDWQYIEFSVRVVGDSQDVDELAEQIQQEFMGKIEQAQADLAEKYGWSRGQTKCCEKMGYNPPANVNFLPIHDVSEASMPPEYRMLGILEELMAQGKIRMELMTSEEFSKMQNKDAEDQ